MSGRGQGPGPGAHKIDLTPSYDRSNGWFEMLDTIPAALTMSGDHDADYVVVGGGYPGLACARRLGELNPSASVALIEADRIGNNAAGRSSGFAIDHAHNLRAKNFADATPEAQAAARAEIALNRAGLAYLDQTISANRIDCGWIRDGKFHAAATSRGERMLDAFTRGLDAMGEDYSTQDAEACQAMFGTGFYRRAVHAPHSYLVQPAAMVRGLADTMPPNVAVYENSVVTEVVYGSGGGAPHRIVTATSSVRTPNLILATNGFIEGFGFYHNSLIPIMTWGSITRQLTPEESARIGGAPSYGIIAAHPAGTSVRRLTGTHDRIVVRNIFSFSRRSDFVGRKRWAARTHRRSFERRWPELADVDFEHSWGGAMALTRNSQPVWGELGAGVFAACVHNGVGIARGTIAGKLLAERILGHDESAELLATISAKGRPTANLPFQNLGVRINARARRFIAGREE